MLCFGTVPEDSRPSTEGGPSSSEELHPDTCQNGAQRWLPGGGGDGRELSPGIVTEPLRHWWQTQGPRQKPAFTLSYPCFYLAAAPSSLPPVKEQLCLHSPRITFGPLKATWRLMWPPVKMSMIPLPQGQDFLKMFLGEEK